MNNPSVDFFEAQFRHQVGSGDLALNPFEARVLPHLRGAVLDLGCGLGNLALAAARQGCRVTALDASPTAIGHLDGQAERESLPLTARLADLIHYRIQDDWDSIVAIGLLMFLPEPQARVLLSDMARHTRPGGIAAVNLLVRGTTFMAMFHPEHHTLLAPGEVKTAFPGWDILEERHETFPAPEGRVKVFDTLVVRKPG